MRRVRHLLGFASTLYTCVRLCVCEIYTALRESQKVWIVCYSTSSIISSYCSATFRLRCTTNHPDAKKRHRAHNRSISYIMCERAVSTTRELHSSRRQALVRLPTRRHDLVHTKCLVCWFLALAPGSGLLARIADWFTPPGVPDPMPCPCARR